MASNFFNKASLVMVPDAPIDGKLPSVKPEDRSGDFTFSRGSNLAATRVNKDGLIEKGRENIFLRSNEFNLTWNTYNATIASGATDPNGGSTAWTLAKTGTYGDIGQVQSGITGVLTFSVYAKAGTLDHLQLSNSASPFIGVMFNLTNGSVASEANNISSNITSIGGGWYRLEAVVNQSAGGEWRLQPADGVGGVPNANLGNVIIYKAQLEYGLVATEYIETTTAAVQKGILENLPRLDYSGGATCPSLLLEPSRTNLVSQSEYFGGSDWTKSGSSVVSGFTSPEGLSNAYNLIEDTSNGTHRVKVTGISVIANRYNVSVFVKPNGRNEIRVSLANYFSSGTDAYFNLDTKVITYGTRAANGLIETLANGWFKCSFSSTSGEAAGPNAWVYIDTALSATNSYQGDGTSGVYIYGAQLEQGSYPTSYIPTYGTSVTRSIDSCQIASGISGLLPQGTGTMYVEATIDDDVNTEGYLMRIEQASFANTIFIARSAAGNLSGSYRNNNSTIFSLQKNNVADTFKAAFAFESGNSVLYVNGEKINASSVTYTPAVTYDDLRVGGYSANTANISGVVSQAMVFKTRLTDDECIALTTI